MAFNRYRKKEKLKRQYTLTRSKAIIAFLLSALFSVFLSAYFERYGRLILRKIFDSAFASVDHSVSHTYQLTAYSNREIWLRY